MIIQIILTCSFFAFSMLVWYYSIRQKVFYLSKDIIQNISDLQAPYDSLLNTNTVYVCISSGETGGNTDLTKEKLEEIFADKFKNPDKTKVVLVELSTYKASGENKDKIINMAQKYRYVKHLKSGIIIIKTCLEEKDLTEEVKRDKAAIEDLVKKTKS